jgi:hypothetical protein
MRYRSLAVVGALAAAIAVSLVRVASQTQALKTPWGEPDLQGIWYDTNDTPFERAPRYGNREFFTPEEIADMDKRRSEVATDRPRQTRGSERDVSGAYNAVFNDVVKPTGKRTSLVVDPPDGRIPDTTPEFKKRRAEFESFRLALLQATETCRKQEGACRGGKFGPPSPRRAELPPMYNTERLNRADGPEDRSMPERCMETGLPDIRGYRRIVQSPASITIAYDVRQGQAWMRPIRIDGSPHLPAHIRQWRGDSRARWDGNTLVIDVTNFTAKFDFRGSRENLHLIERWTRLSPTTLEYYVTIEDPTVWIRPWSFKQEFTRQDEQANRIYYEPRCHEGNYGLTGMLLNTRASERDFAEGKGPDPATRDTATGGAGGPGDPLNSQE